MKNTKWIISLFLIATLAGCKKGNEDANLITIDVKANYPKKELILQDFMDVEYIPLETNNEFLTQGYVVAIGDKYILAINRRNNDGDIFIFDRKTGKGLKKINRKGQGGEEYTYISGVVLDEENNEIFVNSNKILVYDLSGNFKRSFNPTEGAQYLEVFNYDKDNLIRYDMSVYYKDGKSKEKPFYHAIISKQDGSITCPIPIPFDIVKAPLVQNGDGMAITSVRPIISYHDDWILVETSSDTVYNYIPEENKLSPFLVRTSSKDPEIFLTLGTLTNRYYFMKTIKKVFDFTTGRGFPNTDLMYDKQENAVFNATVFNSDFVKKQKVDMTSRPINDKIATYQIFAANELVEAYGKDELKGELKEVAAKLNEESNPVIMLVKYKE